jgi:hypothetical protein
MKVLKKITEYLKFNKLALKDKQVNQLERKQCNKVSLLRKPCQESED